MAAAAAAAASPKYLISRFADPLFALSIGFAAAYVRIAREERERRAAYLSSSTSPSPSPAPTATADATSAAPMTKAVTARGANGNAMGNEEGAYVDAGSETIADLWEKLKRRVGKVEASSFVPDWRGEKKVERWGIVEPGQN